MIALYYASCCRAIEFGILEIMTGVAHACYGRRIEEGAQGVQEACEAHAAGG
jgi:hypothetical protein